MADGELHRPADPHRRIGVDEVEATARLDPKKEIEKSGEGGRFTRFVGAVDDVEVGLTINPLAKFDAMIGKLAVNV